MTVLRRRPGGRLYCVILVLLLILGAKAEAGEEMGLLLVPRATPAGWRLAGEGGAMAEADATDGNGSLSQRWASLSAGTRLAGDADDEWLAGLRSETIDLDTDADDGLDGAWWRLGGSLAWRTWTEAGRCLAGQLRVTSASDRPFASRHEVGVGASLACRLPSRGHDGWILGLDYDTDRSFAAGWPLPLVAWQHIAAMDRRLLIGLPFILADWRLAGPWSVDAALFPSDETGVGGRAGTSWRHGPWRVRLGLGGQTASFRPADRDDPDDRLVISDWRAGVRGEWSPAPPIGLAVESGWAFARRLAWGEDDDERERNHRDIEAAPYLAVSARWAF